LPARRSRTSKQWMGGAMSMARQTALVGTFIAAALTVGVAFLPAGHLPRIGLGILIVFLLPGFAVTAAVFPARDLSLSDRLLASLGISLVATVCTAVLLAALPIGLTRGSLSVALGGGTVIASACALLRARSRAAHHGDSGVGVAEPDPGDEEE
jgi:uncharacterized membrane protein